ncbi:hypothetical protein Tco_1372065 [Tanacetum coccineum]
MGKLSSEDVDEERETKAPPEIRSQSSGLARETIMGNIPLLLASHLRETERRRRTLSPKGTTGVSGDPPTVNGIKRREGKVFELSLPGTQNQRIAGFVHGVKIKSLIKFISTELPKSYDRLMDKVYSWLQAEETASEGHPVTFMDNGGGKPQKGRPQKGSGRKNKERRDRYSPYKESNPGILQNLSKTLEKS